jgi:hypothetical protein
VRRGEKELWTTTVPGATGDGTLERFVIASEPLDPGEAWEPVGDDEVIGIDGAMRLRRWKLDELLGRRP